MALLGGDDLLERHASRKIVADEFDAVAVGEPRSAGPEVIAEEVDEGRDHADAGLHELHVDEPSAGPMGHGVAVAGDVGRIEIGGEELARAAGGEDRRLGADDHRRPVQRDGDHAVTDPVADDQVGDHQPVADADATARRLHAERLHDRLEVVLDHVRARLGRKAGPEHQVVVALPLEGHAIVLEEAHRLLGLARHDGAETRVGHALRRRQDVAEEDVRGIAGVAGIVGNIEGADLGDAVEGRAAAPEFPLDDDEDAGAAGLGLQRRPEGRRPAADDEHVGLDHLASIRHRVQSSLQASQRLRRESAFRGSYHRVRRGTIRTDCA